MPVILKYIRPVKGVSLLLKDSDKEHKLYRARNITDKMIKKRIIFYLDQLRQIKERDAKSIRDLTDLAGAQFEEGYDDLMNEAIELKILIQNLLEEGGI